MSDTIVPVEPVEIPTLCPVCYPMGMICRLEKEEIMPLAEYRFPGDAVPRQEAKAVITRWRCLTCGNVWIE